VAYTFNSNSTPYKLYTLTLVFLPAQYGVLRGSIFTMSSELWIDSMSWTRTTILFDHYTSTRTQPMDNVSCVCATHNTKVWHRELHMVRRSINHLLRSLNFCPKEYAGYTLLLRSCLTYPTPVGRAYLPGPGPVRNESFHLITTLAITGSPINISTMVIS